MLDVVKKYARRVLLLHLLLLLVVVALILEAARQVRTSAREQVQAQAQERLKLLADQTARGLELQYGSILSDLDVIVRDVVAATMPATVPAATAPAPATASGRARGPRGAGSNVFGRGRTVIPPRLLTEAVVVNQNTLSLMWRQLRGRVSQIVLVDLNVPSPWVRQPQYAVMALPDNEQAQATAQSIAAANIDWLRGIKGVQMSPFKKGTEGKSGYHLIALPAEVVDTQTGDTGGGFAGSGGAFGGSGGVGAGMAGGPGGGVGGPSRGGFGPGGPGPGPGDTPGGPGGPGGSGTQTAPAPPPIRYAVVVVVPIDRVREQFLDPLNSQEEHEINAMLVNDSGMILAASNLKAGTILMDQVDPSVRDDIENLVKRDHAEPESMAFDKAFTMGDRTIPPQVVAAAQLEVPSGRHWTVLISSPLSEVETVVNQVFGKAVAWAIFLTVSVTAILVSTSFFMIRSRMRMERMQHEVLTREVEQARTIQLAWLPELKSAPAGIEVSAANLPASHISGDFYNWFALPAMMAKTGLGGEHADEGSGRVAVVIGDVTGHGMAAAFLMATTQLLVRMTLSRYQDAGRCLQEVNKQLCMQSGSTFKGQFVTMLVMILDARRGTVQVASAGHPTPLVEAAGRFQALEIEPQLVLGVNPDEDYHAHTYPLEPGATLVLYTDGLVEAVAPSGAQYGVENLMKVLREQTGKAAEPERRVQGILADVKRYCDGRELLDDVTLVAIRTRGAAVGAKG